VEILRISHSAGVIQRHFILATAGHVDHGKTALVKALTGTDTDRLPEEKARGITIDLGFAHLALPSTTNHQPSTLSVGIIDVPGHEDFIRHMIAGVGSIDLALLVVAADDGWMPQTEEHLQILLYLGVKRLVIAITKCDLGNPEAIAVQVREQLRDSDLAEAPIVSTSVRLDSGLEELREALAAEFSRLTPARDTGKPRLFVDRAFTLRGIGTVVTGTLIGGQFSRGDEVMIQPGGWRARIRSLQSHQQEFGSAGPSMRTAINLPDISLVQPAGISRGDVVTKPELGPPSDRLDIVVRRSARATRPLKHGAAVYLHHGTSRYRARLLLLGNPELLPGERALSQLCIEGAVLAFAGDRFVLRDPSERHTLAGGIVLDPDGDRKKFRTDAQRKFLAARADALFDSRVFVLSELTRDGARHRGSLLIKSNFSAEEINAAASALEAAGWLVRHGDIVAETNWWRRLKDRAATTIDAEHHAYPDRVGLDVTSFRAALGELEADIINALIADLTALEFRQIGAALKRTSHQPALSAPLQADAAKVRAALSAKPFDPPSRKEVAPDAGAQQALRFLIQAGEVVELAPDVVLLAASFERMKAQVAKFLAGQEATAGELRQILGTSRRIIIPFLERLDRDSLTIRRGDRRALRSQPP
jgi:selenocysteine-specific elongation factor